MVSGGKAVNPNIAILFESCQTSLVKKATIEAAMSSNNQNKKPKNAFIERALAIGINQVGEQEEEENFFTLKLTESLENKLDKLFKFLGLSWGNLLNVAVRYSVFYAETKQVSLSQLLATPKHLGCIDLAVELNVETTSKLPKDGMEKLVAECAVFGIETLYAKLIENI